MKVVRGFKALGMVLLCAATQAVQAEGFVKGTLVLTAQGKVEIQKLQCHDKVLSFNHESKQVEEQEVTFTRSQAVNSFRRLTINNTTLDVADDHLFYCIDQVSDNTVHEQWVKAADLQKGQVLFKSVAETVVLEATEEVAQPVEVYDIRVGLSTKSELGNHNFFVSPDMTNGILVHNFAFLGPVLEIVVSWIAHKALDHTYDWATGSASKHATSGKPASAPTRASEHKSKKDKPNVTITSGSLGSRPKPKPAARKE